MFFAFKGVNHENIEQRVDYFENFIFHQSVSVGNRNEHRDGFRTGINFKKIKNRYTNVPV